MPKHVPTFKHLIATSHTRGQTSQDRERTVNDLLNASRSSQRENIVQSSRGTTDLAWSSFATAGASTPAEDGFVHPAELLRRAHAAQRQASRSVAGPAPPPSWRSTPASGKAQAKKAEPTREQVSPVDLRRSGDLFSHRPRDEIEVGPPRLIDACSLSILRDLNSTDAIADGVRLGDIMRSQICYLSKHLKLEILDINSLLPGDHKARMNDKSFKALLSLPVVDEGEVDPDEDEIDAEWTDALETIHHLPLMLHPSPASILRVIPSLPAVALTSLNLAYSTLSDIERLVSVLPPSLRELGLCGVRFKGDSRLANGEMWRRGLAALARKLIVLTMLDLSDPPFPFAPSILASMCHPPTARFPSLRILGLRDAHLDDCSGGKAEDSLSKPSASILEQRRKIVEVVRGQGRQRFVDIVW